MKLIYSISLIILGMSAHAQQTNYHFSHSITTTASPERIWQIWTDVPNWKAWDSGLKEARLSGAFQEGAKGTLLPDKGPESKFVIEDVNENGSYKLKTKIPFGRLIVSRYLKKEDGMVTFTHDVKFTGMLRKLLGNKIGKRYREMLPSVMGNIKLIAEAEN